MKKYHNHNNHAPPFFGEFPSQRRWWAFFFNRFFDNGKKSSNVQNKRANGERRWMMNDDGWWIMDDGCVCPRTKQYINKFIWKKAGWTMNENEIFRPKPRWRLILVVCATLALFLDNFGSETGARGPRYLTTTVTAVISWRYTWYTLYMCVPGSSIRYVVSARQYAVRNLFSYY